MKRVLKIKVLTILFSVLCFNLHAQQLGRSLKVLLIGNSFSQNGTRFLPQMAKEAHIDLQLGRAEMGGCSLKRHWDSVMVNNADSTRGRAYNGKSLRQLLASQKWDIVTIQQYSLLSGNESTYQPYAKNLYDLVKSYQPNAKIMVHQTWAYRADAINWGETGDKQKARNMEEMWQKSRAAYRKLSNDLGGLDIIPSGDAFYTVATDKKWGFVKDTTFNSKTAVYPDLPHDKNSLNVGYSWSGDKKLNFDPNHASDAGCYLAGMVWYRFVLKQDPAKLSFKPEKVDDNFAGFLKVTAAKVSSAIK